MSILFMLSGTSAYADDANPSGPKNNELINVSQMEPSPLSLKSASRPSQVWNIATQGTYDFAGWSYGETLYTNYKFKGK